MILRAAGRTAVPWRNGAGLTEPVVEGDGWRVSIATIDAAAPFSRFDGYDRTLVVLEGGPVTLAGLGSLSVGGAFAFAGEGAIEAAVAAPARVLNVMTVRGRWRHAVEAVAAPFVVPAGVLAVVTGGAFHASGAALARLDAVAGPDQIAGSGTLLAIRIVPQNR